MSVQLNTIYNDDCPKCMNTKEELRDILEEHHSIVTDELGERLITALDEYIQDRESALLSRAKELVGEDENELLEVSIIQNASISRNDLRAKQRLALETLVNSKEEHKPHKRNGETK